jgi:DNA-binding MarR family transcriptional regulator
MKNINCATSSSNRERLIYRALHDVYVFLDALDRSLLTPFELTSLQYRVLTLLNESSSLRLTDLSDRLLVARSTVTRLVDALEKRDLVQRIFDETDRRAQWISLTQHGHRLRTQIDEIHDKALKSCLADLSEDEKADMVQKLTHLGVTARQSYRTSPD